MTETEKLEQLVTDAFNASQTFTEEMMVKARNELLKAAREAAEYYKEKAETD